MLDWIVLLRGNLFCPNLLSVTLYAKASKPNVCPWWALSLTIAAAQFGLGFDASFSLIPTWCNGRAWAFRTVELTEKHEGDRHP